jgi:hypothetical protein
MAQFVSVKRLSGKSRPPFKFDGPVKSQKKADFKVSRLIISIGYKIKK